MRGDGDRPHRRGADAGGRRGGRTRVAGGGRAAGDRGRPQLWRCRGRGRGAEAATRTFLQDCDREAVEQAHARLVRQSAAVITGPVQAAAWQHVPSTYVVCAQDNGTPAAVQRVQAGRATHVVEVATGHHPFLSRPSVVARLLLDLA
nr:alpha/beta fold hydrolase [Nonomuraea sp. LP-02]